MTSASDGSPGGAPGGGDAGEPGASGEPRIIWSDKKADESWKEKARKEKEKLSDAEREAAEASRQLPPASFPGLLEELAVRAMLALGQFRDPGTGEIYIDLEAARYTIDLLAMLEVKTKGNLDASEQAALTDLLKNLRLTFVHVSRHLAAAAPGGSSGPPPAAGAKGGGPAPPEKPGPKIIY